MLNVGKKMWPISALLGELVGVAGFEPAIPSSRTRERGVRVETKFLFRFKASVSTRTLRKYLIQPNMGHLPGPPPGIFAVVFIYIFPRCDTQAPYRCDNRNTLCSRPPLQLSHCIGRHLFAV